jgi:hypothetical protein
MSDAITAHIAAVISKYAYRSPRFVAAAVVEELGLYQTWEHAGAVGLVHDTKGDVIEADEMVTRYMTEWVRDA